jgi:hypothetical protein
MQGECLWHSPLFLAGNLSAFPDIRKCWQFVWGIFWQGEAMRIPAVKVGNSVVFQKLFERAQKNQLADRELDQLVNHWMACRIQERMIGARRHRTKRAIKDTKKSMIWPKWYLYERA